MLFWYFRISWRETVPGLNLWGFFTPPVAGADFLAALVASCFRGALPPVELNPLENRLRQQLLLVLVLVPVSVVPKEVKNKRRIPVKRSLDKIPGFRVDIWWRFSS